MTDDTETANPSQELADEYVRLGGQRKSVLDDNLVFVRHWEDDTPEAEALWQDRIETLSVDERRDVEKFLPAINSL